MSVEEQISHEKERLKAINHEKANIEQLLVLLEWKLRNQENNHSTKN